MINAKLSFLIFGNKVSSLTTIESARFNLHNESFRPVLAQIRQTVAQEDQLIANVISITGQKKKISAEIIADKLTFPIQDKELVVSFLDANLTQISKLPEPAVAVWNKFSVEAGISNRAVFQELVVQGKDLAAHTDKLADLLGYSELVNSLATGLGESALPVLYALREYSAINEFLVCLTFEPQVAIYGGSAVFIKIVYVMHKKGCFIDLISAVSQSIELENVKPFRTLAGKFIYERRLYVIPALAFGSALILPGTPVDIPETFVYFSEHLAKFAPTNVYVKLVFEFAHECLRAGGYMVGALATSPVKGFIAGVVKSSEFITNAVEDHFRKTLKAIMESNGKLK